MCVQNKEESAELGRRKKTVQASEQELLAKQETAKEEEGESYFVMCQLPYTRMLHTDCLF